MIMTNQHNREEDIMILDIIHENRHDELNHGDLFALPLNLILISVLARSPSLGWLTFISSMILSNDASDNTV